MLLSNIDFGIIILYDVIIYKYFIYYKITEVKEQKARQI